MSEGTKKNPLEKILQLDETQLKNLVKTVDELWRDGTITINNTELGYEVFMYAPKIEELTIDGFDKKEVRSIISAGLSTVNIVSDFDTVDEIQKIFEISDNDKPKLVKVFDEIKKLKSLGEISYLTNTLTPIIDVKTIQYSIKKVIEEKYNIPIVSVNFVIRQGNERKTIHAELSYAGLKELNKELQKAEKDLQALIEK